MLAQVNIAGTGHAVGSKTVSNADLAVSMGLAADWFTRRTGIEERRVCDAGEDVLSLAVSAVESALRASGLDHDAVGAETVLLHIQNGMLAFAPPSGVMLANALGLKTLRTLSIEGVCAEPVSMFEMAALLLTNGRCGRVIISSSVDFLPVISPADRGTVGLFGAGAGAAVIEPRSGSHGMPATIRSIRWLTYPDYDSLGRIPILGYQTNAHGVSVQAGYYDMNGLALIRAGSRLLPPLVEQVMNEAGWKRDDVDVVIAHQPNVPMLDRAITLLGMRREIFPMPVVHLGNMGPASLMVNLSLARDAGLLRPGRRVLLVAFGLGFSCGAAALDLSPD